MSNYNLNINSDHYKIGYLFYGSIFSDFNKNDIIDGPILPIRLSGLAFPNTNKIRLTRNLHPNGTPTRSSICIRSTFDIKKTISDLSNREYYDNYDQEPICYFKRKPRKRSVLKIPFYDSYIDILSSYNFMLKHIYYELSYFSEKYNLDYIFFISYNHRIDLLNIDHRLSDKVFNKQLLKLIYNNLDNILISNTKTYLKLCDKSTYTWLEHLIVEI
jgi:hypothetical protein